MKRNFYLLLFILIASVVLISINYYTIKILSAVRAYINGESEYSKGQKDASLYLYTYIETEDSSYIAAFNNAIWVPMSDNLARKSIINNYSDQVTADYFMIGRNHPDDIPGMIWLFKTFRGTYMKTPILLWTDAEPLLNRLYNMGVALNAKVRSGSLSPEEKVKAVQDISQISAELYKRESEFSQVLGDTARKITNYLLWANILCVLVIISNISLYAIVTIRRLSRSYQQLQATNKEIVETNKELDTLVYSVSHDLRSPITSIMGLIHISKDEQDIDGLRECMNLIETTIKQQDIFIMEIIDFFRSKRTSLNCTKFSLKALIETVVASNKFSLPGKSVTITRLLDLDHVYTDELRVKMIVNNLVSNAIKYSDDTKPEKTVLIKTYNQFNEIVIEVIDNGIGIDEQHIDKIFNMFFVTSHSQKGTGLGLYILKQNVGKLKGRVHVQSVIGSGSTFTVHLPMMK